MRTRNRASRCLQPARTQPYHKLYTAGRGRDFRASSKNPAGDAEMTSGIGALARIAMTLDDEGGTQPAWDMRHVPLRRARRLFSS